MSKNLDLKGSIPDCERARSKGFGSQLEVRETRRIRSVHTLTVDDLIGGREFSDTIGYSSYRWDLPDPKAMAPCMAMGEARVTPQPLRPNPTPGLHLSQLTCSDPNYKRTGPL